MKTHLLCMDMGYWILKKSAKTIIADFFLENCIKDKRDLFVYDMRAREEILTTLLGIEYN